MSVVAQCTNLLSKCIGTNLTPEFKHKNKAETHYYSTATTRLMGKQNEVLSDQVYASEQTTSGRHFKALEILSNCTNSSNGLAKRH